MELLQLKYFCAAAESENFSKIAKLHNVPTSNISQSIKRLEKELGSPLFTRTANRVTLNNRGKEFFTKIKKALNIIENAKEEICGNTTGTMKIGIFANRRIVMKAVEKFQKEHTNIDVIIIHEAENTDTDFDIVISSEIKEIINLQREKFFSERVLLAAKKGFFKDTKNITANDIKNKPFILMKSGTNLYNTNKKICSSLGFTPRVALQSDDPFYIRKCIELGLGIAFVPEFSWQGQFSDEIQLIEFGNYTRDTYIYRRSKDYEPWYTTEFYRILKEIYRQEVDMSTFSLD